MSVSTPSLRTERLRLRPFTAADGDDIYGLQSDPVVLQYWDSPPWTDRASIARFLNRSEQMAEEGTGARVVIERESDGAFVGWVTFTQWNATYRSACLGYCLTQQSWGNGYATEAATAMLQWAFESFDLNRVESEVDTRNPASARVLEELGFILEGTLRENCIVSGDISDSWVYGLLRRDWEQE